MEANNFTILWWFLPYIDMNQPRVYMCPEPRFYLPPHPIPLGCPRAPTLSALFYALNLDWSSISHTCLNAILSNHPTLTFSHRVNSMLNTNISHPKILVWQDFMSCISFFQISDDFLSLGGYL